MLLASALTQAGAQGTSTYQSVGEDFGRTWISDFSAQSPTNQDTNSSTLWSWGGAPLGKTIVNGQLASDNGSSLWYYNKTANWLETGYIDPYAHVPEYNLIPVAPGAYLTDAMPQLPPGLQSSGTGA